MGDFLICAAIALLTVILMVKYLEGSFSYNDEVTHQYQMNYTLYTVIHRKYHSGKIKIITRKTKLN